MSNVITSPLGLWFLARAAVRHLMTNVRHRHHPEPSTPAQELTAQEFLARREAARAKGRHGR